MDGLEATMRIRQMERQRGTHVPIVAMTAHALKGDRERCIKAGMDAYLAKPIRAHELFDAIDSVCLAPDKPAVPGAETAADDPVNWSEALDAVRGDRQLLATVVEAALEEIPRLLDELRQATANGDTTALRLSAHTLKGSLRYFGRMPAFEQALALEKLGHDHDMSAAAATLALLEPELVRVVAAFRASLAGIRSQGGLDGPAN
jgi:two-component system, sensor histidine kinase and response regulator